MSTVISVNETTTNDSSDGLSALPSNSGAPSITSTEDQAEVVTVSTDAEGVSTAIGQPEVDGKCSTSDDTFELFPKLPIELRLRIWALALPEGHVVEISYFFI